MPRAITRITQPVQLHAEGLQISHSRRLLRMATQEPDSLEIETFTGSSEGMQMIGVRAAQADHASGSTGFCGA